jgi:hypothetical protein
MRRRVCGATCFAQLGQGQARLESTRIPAIPLPRALHPPRYGLPPGTPEASGGADPAAIISLPQFSEIIREAGYFPNRDDLWRANSSVALDRIAKHSSYFELSRYAMDHGFFHLLHDMLVAKDAPLPHVMYEDFMKVKTFASLQETPEQQFALEPSLLRGMLCVAAHHLLLDKGYFPTCEALFRRIDKEQTVGPEVLSAWIFCCAAAGKIDLALSFASFLDASRAAMDPLVCSLMMHPSLNPTTAVGPQRSLFFNAKSVLMQQRMSRQLSSDSGAAGAAVHAMFVMFSLTLSHVRKWELLRLACERHTPLAERTVTLALHAFREEQGMLCGPKTCKALLHAILESRRGEEDYQLARVLLLLLRMRKNELLPRMQQFAPAHFSDDECEFVLARLSRHRRSEMHHSMVAPGVDSKIHLGGGEHDNGDGDSSHRAADHREALALPLVEALLRHSEPRHVAAALSNAANSLQNLVSGRQPKNCNPDEENESGDADGQRYRSRAESILQAPADDGGPPSASFPPPSSHSFPSHSPPPRPPPLPLSSRPLLASSPSLSESNSLVLEQLAEELLVPRKSRERKKKKKISRERKAVTPKTVEVLPSVDPLHVPQLVRDLAASADVRAMWHAGRAVAEEEQLAERAAVKLRTAWISMD